MGCLPQVGIKRRSLTRYTVSSLCPPFVKVRLYLHFDVKNQSGQRLQVPVIGGPFKKSYRKYSYQKWFITSFRVNFFGNLKEKNIVSLEGIIISLYNNLDTWLLSACYTCRQKSWFFLQNYFRIGVLAVFLCQKNWHETGPEEIYDNQSLSDTE